MTITPTTAASLARGAALHGDDPAVIEAGRQAADYFRRVEVGLLNEARKAPDEDAAVRSASQALGTWSSRGDVKLTDATPARVCAALLDFLAGRS